MDERRTFLTYSQLSVWRSLEPRDGPDRAASALTRIWDVPAATGTERVTAALDALTARHDALRCRFELDHEDEPRQVLPAGPSPSGLQVTDDPHVPVPALDLERGPGWLARVELRDGAPVRVVVTVHHLIADVATLEIMRSEFFHLLAGGRLDPAPSPFDLADEQRSVGREGRRERAIAHWVAVAAAVQPYLGDATAGLADVAAATPRWATLRSEPAAAAAAALAAAVGTSVPTVVLAAQCRLLARRSSAPRFVVGLTAGNRATPRWRSVVCSMDSLTPMVFEHRPGEPLAATVARIHRAALTAYSHAVYDVDEVAAAIEEHGMFAVGVGIDAYFNWLPTSVTTTADPVGGWHVEAHPTGRDNGVACALKAFGDRLLHLRWQERRPGADDTSTVADLTRLHEDLLAGGRDG